MISGQKTAFELAKHHEVIVVTTGRKPGREKRGDRLTVYRLKDIFLPDPINYSIVFGLFLAVRTIVAKERPDACIINKHMFYTSLSIWTVKRMGVPVIVQTDTFPGIVWFPRKLFVRVVMWVYARLIGNLVLKAADEVILLHEGLIPTAKRLGLTYKVIHNGVDLVDLAKSEPPTDITKPSGEVWVGYVGRLESIKGWYDLAQVARSLVDEYPHVRWLFVGQNQSAYARIASEFAHPHLKFLGQRTDVLGIYKLLDVFVLPSYSEGLPNALMEAMAHRLCCLSSDVGGVRYLIEDNVSGLLFTPGNQDQLREKLRNVLDDYRLREKLGAAARSTIENHYSLDHTTHEISTLLLHHHAK